MARRFPVGAYVRYAVVALAFGIAGCNHDPALNAGRESSIPNLAGLHLNDARDDLQNMELEIKIDVRDALGERVVLRESNWRVVDQRPAPGAQLGPDSEVCLSVLKDDEYLDKANLDLIDTCNEPGVALSSTSTAVSNTTGEPKSREESLNALGVTLSAGERVAISESVCGIFSFLVSADGTYHFHEWTNNEWVRRTELTDGLLIPNLQSVEAIDVTGDSVDDFFVVLPTWDPLSKAKPMSGAVFAQISCKWQWLSFRTTTKQDWYQLDNLRWDSQKKLFYGGDEISDMYSASYTGERKTEMRYFRFQPSTGDFRLTNAESTARPSTTNSTSSIPTAGAELPAEVRRAVINSCNWPAADLAAAYGVSSKSKRRIAEAVAADFQERFQPFVIPLCMEVIK